MMKSAPILLALACTSLVAAACSQQYGAAPASARPAGRQCFHANQVSNFIPRSDTVVDVQVGVRRYYRLELAGICPDVNWTFRVALVSRGSSWICRGLDAELIVPNRGLGPQRCLVSSVRPLSDAEARALRYYR